MPIPRKKRVRIGSLTVSEDSADYLKHLKDNGFNASQEVDDAIRTSSGFKAYIKEKNK